MKAEPEPARAWPDASEAGPHVYATAYALPPDSQHPKSIYLSEAAFIGSLADWLTSLFAPANLDANCELLASSADVAPDDNDRAANRARYRLATANERIRRCEDALEAGGDVSTITGWLNTAVADRDLAQRVLAATPASSPLTPADFRRMIEALPNPAYVFLTGKAEDVQRLLDVLGVELRYHPVEKTLTASVGLSRCATDGVEGGT